MTTQVAPRASAPAPYAGAALRLFVLLLDVAQQLVRAHPERGGDAAQAVEVGLLFAALDPPQMRFVHASEAAEDLLGHAPLLAQAAYRFSDRYRVQHATIVTASCVPYGQR